MSNMKSPLPQCASMVRIQNILSGKWKNNNFMVYMQSIKYKGLENFAED